MDVWYLTVCLFRGRCPCCACAYRRGVCPACRAAGPSGRKTPGGLQCWALGSYGGTLRDEIGRLKYSDETWLAQYLGGSLARVVSPPAAPAALVPVPLHPARLVERGYNQSALLARAVAHHHRLSVEYGLLQRSVATGQQARLKRAERALNVQAAFSARQGRRALASTQLWLVDDVITTGQTIDACAQALEQAGYTVAGALCCALSGDP